jgi:hypothetical protein
VTLRIEDLQSGPVKYRRAQAHDWGYAAGIYGYYMSGVPFWDQRDIALSWGMEGDYQRGFESGMRASPENTELTLMIGAKNYSDMWFNRG